MTITTSKPDHIEKEHKMRKLKIWRDVVGLSIIAAFIILVFFYEMDLWVRTALVLLGAVYLIYTMTKLKNSMKQYYSLHDDLVVKNGHITKVNSKIGRKVWKMPLEHVVKVCPNIKGMPNTLYVLFERDGKKGAENFYKHRIKNPEDVEKLLEERGLLEEKYISVDDLKRSIESNIEET
ncbi:MAG: hypothetical protein R6U17_07385 [Thermoplasmata archaeon]